MCVSRADTEYSYYMYYMYSSLLLSLTEDRLNYDSKKETLITCALQHLSIQNEMLNRYMSVNMKVLQVLYYEPA